MELGKSALIQKIEDMLLSVGLKDFLNSSEPLFQYLDLLFQKNQAMNLVSVRSFEELITVHLYDSLMVTKLLPEIISGNGCVKAMDIGSGGGFPALPVAIVAFKSQWILVESIQKKVEFLRQTVKELKLCNIMLIPFRVEEFIKSCPIPPLNLITFRAVGKIGVLYPFIQIFRKRHIPVMLWKNPNEVDEYNKSLKDPIPYTDYPYPVKDGFKHILLIK